MLPLFTFDPLLSSLLLAFPPLLLKFSLPPMHPAPVRSHAVEGLVFRVALLTHIALVGVPVSSIHVVPYVCQLVARVVAPQALVQPISLSERLNFCVTSSSFDCEHLGKRRVVCHLHVRNPVRNIQSTEVTFEERP